MMSANEIEVPFPTDRSHMLQVARHYPAAKVRSPSQPQWNIHDLSPQNT